MRRWSGCRQTGLLLTNRDGVREWDRLLPTWLIYAIPDAFSFMVNPGTKYNHALFQEELLSCL